MHNTKFQAIYLPLSNVVAILFSISKQHFYKFTLILLIWTKILSKGFFLTGFTGLVGRVNNTNTILPNT